MNGGIIIVPIPKQQQTEGVKYFVTVQEELRMGQCLLPIAYHSVVLV
jgi:hypothetical protein